MPAASSMAFRMAAMTAVVQVSPPLGAVRPGRFISMDMEIMHRRDIRRDRFFKITERRVQGFPFSS